MTKFLYKRSGYRFFMPGVAVIGLMMILPACAPTTNSFTRRTYHNITAHYNAYFNGRESLKEGIATLSKNHDDDYNKILPVFRLGTEQQARSLASKWERALKKASIVIQRHSFAPHNAKNEEYCNWIDDSYMMIGMSHFYNRDYRSAEETFDFVVRKYNKSPVKYEAQLWQVLTRSQRGQFEGSLPMLSAVEGKIGKEHMSPKTIRFLPLVAADFHIKQKNYVQATEYLNQAVNQHNKKKIRIRLTFILAQIRQANGELAEASRLYKKVIGMNPPYVMAFTSKINMAKCYDAGSNNSKLIRKELDKMIRDDKNKEYLDQIYFALAEISLKEKDTLAAKGHLKTSASASMNNNKQKSLSFEKLAALFYVQLDYRNAQLYYDSAVHYMDKDHERYEATKEISEVLTGLVENISTVELQDSLQRIGRMGETERVALIDGVIRAIKEEEQRIKMEEALRQKELAQLARENRSRQQVMGPGGGDASGWYFYNSSALSFGHTEFITKWGDRKLEDLWRLKNKTVFSFDDQTANAKGDTLVADSVVTLSKDKKDRKYYLDRIPKTPEQFAASDTRIRDALYKIGFIYQNQLADYPKAVAAFEEYLRRFPTDKTYQLKSYYNLYKTYGDQLHNKTQSHHYKNLILKDYPNSDYAQIILDPTYYQKLREKESESARFYSHTYQAFQQGQWQLAKEKCELALTQFPHDKLEPQFQYLRALCIGKTARVDSLRKPMEHILAAYAGTDISAMAGRVLAYLDKEMPNEVTGQDAQETTLNRETPAYTYTPEAVHLYALLADIRERPVSDIRQALEDFNKTRYEKEMLSVSNKFWNDTLQIITVANFKGVENARQYLSALKGGCQIFQVMKPAAYRDFLITARNLSFLSTRKDIEVYLDFYQEKFK